MVVELRPLGVACNLACTYCYQEPVRMTGNNKPKYDIDLMLKKTEETGQQFSLFGGEALLIPKKDLEIFLKRSFELHGSSGLQTNGTLIDDDHIALFKKYNSNVGISIDGPNELNGLRQVRGGKNETKEERTLNSTKTIMKNISLLTKHEIRVGVIITLHRINASKEVRDRLKNFLLWLKSVGVKNGNIHLLEVDDTMPNQKQHVLTQEENIEVFLELAEFFDEHKDLKYKPFLDYEDAMNSKYDTLTCYLNRCDPLNTQAVYGIEGNGSISNCGRTNKEGIDWLKADDVSYERYISLYNTPHEFGGCKGCRFFLLCGGSCPGESINNDFRNKTTNCETQKALIGFYEGKAMEKGITPFTQAADLKRYEAYLLDKLIQGQKCTIGEAVHQIKRRKRLEKINRTGVEQNEN